MIEDRLNGRIVRERAIHKMVEASMRFADAWRDWRRSALRSLRLALLGREPEA